MVEYTLRIDNIFSALADPVRRDILERTSDGELTVNEVALEYDMSLAAVSKHLKVLHDADLIFKRKRGRYHMISTNRAALAEAKEYLAKYNDSQSSWAGESVSNE